MESRGTIKNKKPTQNVDDCDCKNTNNATTKIRNAKKRFMRITTRAPIADISRLVTSIEPEAAQ